MLWFTPKGPLKGSSYCQCKDLKYFFIGFNNSIKTPIECSLGVLGYTIIGGSCLGEWNEV